MSLDADLDVSNVGSLKQKKYIIYPQQTHPCLLGDLLFLAKIRVLFYYYIKHKRFFGGFDHGKVQTLRSCF